MDRRHFIPVSALWPVASSTRLRRILASADTGVSGTVPQQPSRRLRDTLGVTIHFVEPVPAQLEAIRNAGFRWVRHDLLWSRVEQTLGKYDFTAYDRHYESLLNNGLSAYAILDYTNALYDDGRPPTPGSKAERGFLQFAEAAAAHYGDVVEAWEVWNEPNIANMWRGTPDPLAYGHLCREASRVIRHYSPNATVLGGATAGIDIPFLEACARNGAFDYSTAISVHPYRWTPPEGAFDEMRELRATIQRLTGRAVDVISGEWGYTTAGGRIAQELQAAYYARMMLTSFAAGNPITVWYDLQQDGNDPTVGEHNFGLMKYATLGALPGYNAAVTLARLLGDSILTGTSTTADGVRLVHLDRRGLVAAALWTTGAQATHTVRSVDRTILVNMFSEQLWRMGPGEERDIQLQPNGGPFYLLGGPVQLTSSGG